MLCSLCVERYHSLLQNVHMCPKLMALQSKDNSDLLKELEELKHSGTKSCC